MKFRRIIAAAVTALIASVGLASCSSSPESSSGSGKVIKIGTTDASKRQWKVFQDEAKKAGFNVQVVPFSDYNTPNDALQQGQIDVNQFQHIKFLANYNAGKNTELTPIVATEIIPLALFWKDHKNLDGIEGQSVAIPNDSTNQGRAINVLVQAGLVKLKNKDILEPTPVDIDESASKVKVTAIDASRCPAVYGEGKPAIINNSFLDRAKINPKSAIFKDDPSNPAAEPYINAFVVKKDRANDKDLIRLGEIWHTKPVQEAIAKDSAGTSVEVKRTPEELIKIENRLREAIKAAKK